jgi:hypothetical protein
MCIHGRGAVDGDSTTMSSTRGKLHSQTAMAIISNLLLSANDNINTKTILYGDNKGVQQTCANIQIKKLKHHRQPNMDLKLEYKHAVGGRTITTEWIKGHQDHDKEWSTVADLQDMKLTDLVIMNTVCDRRANETRKTHLSFSDADVTPNEKWALFSSYPTNRKITSHFDDAVLGLHNTEDMIQYIKWKQTYAPMGTDTVIPSQATSS